MDLATLYWARLAGRAMRERLGDEIGPARPVRERRPARGGRRDRRAVRRIGWATD